MEMDLNLRARVHALEARLREVPVAGALFIPCCAALPHALRCAALLHVLRCRFAACDCCHPPDPPASKIFFLSKP